MEIELHPPASAVLVPLKIFLVPLEVLNRLLVRLSLFSRRERSQILASTRLRVLVP